mmetsp:Transcript_8176/g.14003  ORF Transcript_8176/g.14003 Transcript_8176/m.14003 type:complete len:240 (-) Transcript_8176:50-769(-)
MNYPELLVFAIDLDGETVLQSSPQQSRLELMYQTCLAIAAAKKRTNSQHAFAIAVLKEQATLLMHPTCSLDILAAAALRLRPAEESFSSLDLSSLQLVCAQAAASAPAECRDAQGEVHVRVVLFYGRSCTVPTSLSQSPSVAVDAIYCHERPMPGVNCPQEVFTALEDHCDAMSAKAKHQAYIFECTATNVKRMATIMVWMCAHPSGRVPQQALQLTLSDLGKLAACGLQGSVAKPLLL